MSRPFAGVMRRSAKSGLILPLGAAPDTGFAWNHVGAGATPALVIDNSWPNPAVVTGLNLKQTGQQAPALRIDAVRDVVVTGNRIEHQWRGITSTVAGGTFKESNNTFKGLNPDVDGQMQSWHVNVSAPVQEHEFNSYHGGGGGIYINGVDQVEDTLKVRFNKARNLICVKSNGSGLPGRAGYQVELDKDNYSWAGHFLQLNGCSAPGGMVEGNDVMNKPADPADASITDWGACNADFFNFYRSGGGIGNPLRFRRNYGEGNFSSRWWEIGSSGSFFIADHNETLGAGNAAKLKYIEAEDNFSCRIHNIDYVVWGYADNINIRRARMAESLQLRGTNLALPGNTGRQLIYGADTRTNCTFEDSIAWERAPGYYTVIAGILAGSGNQNLRNGPPQGYGNAAAEDNIRVLWDAFRAAYMSSMTPGSTIPIW